MSFCILQNVVTSATQEQFPDGLISKVGNDSYDYDGAVTKWHNQCVSLKNDAETLKYKCAVVDSQLNIVDNLVEFKDKGTTPQPEAAKRSKSTKSAE